MLKSAQRQQKALETMQRRRMNQLSPTLSRDRRGVTVKDYSTNSKNKSINYDSDEESFVDLGESVSHSHMSKNSFF